MLNTLAGAVIGLFLQDDALQELQAASKKLAELESYTFELHQLTEGERSARPGGGQVSAEDEDDGKTSIGLVQKSLPVHVQRGKVEYFLRGDSVVVKNQKDGTWELVDPNVPPENAAKKPPSGGKGEGKRRPGAGTVKPPSDKEPGNIEEAPPAGKKGSDRRRAMPLRTAANAVQAPHEMLAEIAQCVSKVAKETKEGTTIYTAELTPEAAAEWSGLQRVRTAAAELQSTGSLQVFVDAQGVIERMHWSIHVTGTTGQRPLDRKQTSELKIRDRDKTKVEVPAEVQSLLKS